MHIGKRGYNSKSYWLDSLFLSRLILQLITLTKSKFMNSFWKYTVGLLVEVAIKLLQTVINKSDNVIPGTGANSTTESK